MAPRVLVVPLLGGLASASCAVDAPTTTVQQDLSASVKRERAALIRDSAAQMGVYNAALFGGIAVSETNLAHCWSEATYACQGPASSSCGGGPIIAGSADGACSAQQGGLGMFQFDSGTYAQTLATYGDDILTVGGNTAQAVAFVVARVIQDIDGVNDWNAAVAWINSIPLVSSDPLAQRWGKLMACRYNGCCSTSSLCTSRANGYRDNAIDLHGEMTAEFWTTENRCQAIPDDGIIDQRADCYVAGGDPRFWRRDAHGYADTSEWTGTTTAGKPANFGRWLVRPAGAASYRLEVYSTGSTATAAKYQIVHAGATDTVTIDQAGADGFVELGTFAFSGDGDEYVELGDNTGVADQMLVFDALRITAPDGGPAGGGRSNPNGPDDPAVAGGCATTHGGGLALALLGVFGLLRRRRR